MYVSSLVQKTPNKENQISEDSESTNEEISSDESSNEEPNTNKKSPCTKLFSSIPEPAKRTAQESPEVSEEKKKKKKKRKGTNSDLSVKTPPRSSRMSKKLAK